MLIAYELQVEWFIKPTSYEYVGKNYNDISTTTIPLQRTANGTSYFTLEWHTLNYRMPMLRAYPIDSFVFRRVQFVQQKNYLCWYLLITARFRTKKVSMCKMCFGVEATPQQIQSYLTFMIHHHSSHAYTQFAFISNIFFTRRLCMHSLSMFQDKQHYTWRGT